MNKLGGYRVSYEKMMNELTDKMDAEAFSDNSRLAPLYLLGYHHFTSKMYKANKEEEK
jgi:CRISPR-associated protein Csd1